MCKSEYRTKYHSEYRSESYHFGSIIPGVIVPRVSFWLLSKIINYWPLSFPFWQSLFDGNLQCKVIQTFLLCQWALDMYLEFPHFLGNISVEDKIFLYTYRKKIGQNRVLIINCNTQKFLNFYSKKACLWVQSIMEFCSCHILDPF